MEKPDNTLQTQESKEMINFPNHFFLIIQDFINLLPYYVFIVDEDHNIIIANNTALKAVGKDIESIRGQYCPKLIHGSNGPISGCPLEESLEKGHFIEKEIMDPFYKTWMSSAVYPMKYKTQNGKKIFLHIARDISERKKTEEINQQQKFFLQHLIESITHPLYVINVNNYTIIMANSAANFGKLSETSKCYKLTHRKNKPCNTKEHPCPIEEIKKHKKPIVVEHFHYDSDSNARLFEVHGYPIFDKDGEISQIIEYSLDITERKQNEENLRIIRENIEIKSKKLEEKNTALKVLIELLEEARRDIEKSMDKNIKTLVIPFLEQLNYSSLDENQKNILNIIDTNIYEIIKPFTTRLSNKLTYLSPIEVRIAKMVKDGKTAKDIAEILLISEYTVKEHNAHIRKKLGLKRKSINLKSYLRSIFDE